MSKNKINSPIWISVAAGIVGVFMLVSFVWWTALPFFQVTRFYTLLKRDINSRTSELTEATFPFSPYTYIQPALRANLLETLFTNYQHNTFTGVTPLLPFGIGKMEEVLARNGGTPYALQYMILAKSYSQLVDLAPETAEKNRSIAEGYYEKTLELLPNHQTVLYAYAINLTNQGKVDDARAILEKELAFDPRVPETKYYLGVIQFKSGERYYIDALANLEAGSVPENEQDPALIVGIYQRLASYFYKKQDIERFKECIKQLKLVDAAQSDSYNKILSYIDEHNSIPAISFNGL